MPDGFGNEFVQATGESGTFTDYSSRERERERDEGRIRPSTDGSNAKPEIKSSTSGSTFISEQTRPTASMVVDIDGRRELPILDQQLLTACADTHTHTQRGDHSNRTGRETGKNCWNAGCGNNADRNEVFGILAMALPERSDGLERTSISEAQSESARVRREFNPDPRVADWPSGKSCFNWWVYECHRNN